MSLWMFHILLSSFAFLMSAGIGYMMWKDFTRLRLIKQKGERGDVIVKEGEIIEVNKDSLVVSGGESNFNILKGEAFDNCSELSHIKEEQSVIAIGKKEGEDVIVGFNVSDRIFLKNKSSGVVGLMLMEGVFFLLTFSMFLAYALSLVN